MPLWASGRVRRVTLNLDASEGWIVPTSAQLVAALADPYRLDLFARAVAAGSDGVVPGRATAKPWGKLVQAGLVTRDERGRFVARPGVFRDALDEDSAGGQKREDPVARLFSRGRLVSMPGPGPLREAMLRHVAETVFEPGRTYPEKHVNELLAQCHDDFAILRRYLVEAGLLTRSTDGRDYRRTMP